MKLFPIHSEESIRSFLKEMYNFYQQPFDPADDLRTLTRENGIPFVTKEEGEYFDFVMTQCFIYCILNDLNIYRITNEVQMEIFKNKAVA